MPHKRASARVRKEKKREVDLPVSKEDSNVRDEDTPKGFSRLFRFKEMQIKRLEEKKEARPNKPTIEKKNIKIQPGEKLKDFVQRVEHEYQTDMTSAYKTSKSVSESKKKNREQRKQKKQAKLQRQKDLYGGRDFDDLKDDVKFGEVADAPPTFSKIPKARGYNKELLKEKIKEVQSTKEENEKAKGYESEEDENMKQLKASHKRKIQNMSAAARVQLDNERERAILAYRAKKAKKV